jgi:hypothetical protein
MITGYGIKFLILFDIILYYFLWVMFVTEISMRKIKCWMSLQRWKDPLKLVVPRCRRTVFPYLIKNLNYLD